MLLTIESLIRITDGSGALVFLLMMLHAARLAACSVLLHVKTTLRRPQERYDQISCFELPHEPQKCLRAFQEYALITIDLAICKEKLPVYVRCHYYGLK